MRLVEAEQAVSVIDDSRPAAIRAQELNPQCRPSATPDTCTGPTGRGDDGLHPRPDANTATSDHDARSDTPLGAMRWRTTKPNVSYAACRTYATSCVISKPSSTAKRAVIVEQRTFAEHIKRPHRHPERIDLLKIVSRVARLD